MTNVRMMIICRIFMYPCDLEITAFKIHTPFRIFFQVNEATSQVGNTGRETGDSKVKNWLVTMQYKTKCS